MTLRKYQAESVKKTLAALEKFGSAVLQMPTGAGKTKTAMEIVAGHDGIVWFVCHRREIERQTAKAFREAGIEFGIVSPRSKPDYSKRVQIVLVGTLARRVADLPAPSLVIWDECHHVAAKSWAEIREALTDALHLGLTATPERFDGKASFKRRIGRSIEMVRRLIAAGLPYDHKLGIPIQAALEWVRDNRPDIVIPPEAWPSPAEPADNDNEAATKAA